MRPAKPPRVDLAPFVVLAALLAGSGVFLAGVAVLVAVATRGGGM